MIRSWSEHARDFADEAHEAVRKVAERHGIHVTMKPIAPSRGATLTLTMKAHLTEPKLDGMAGVFLGTHRQLGLDREDLGRRFAWKGRVAKLVGADFGERPLIAQLPDGSMEQLTTDEFKAGCRALADGEIEQLDGDW
ncbi:hypothetical protein [Azospirillum sp. Sh1]|uniref:hypothetical protein n=1 Tax=Azospirillum sp. Sh1 TaxID=2607285 RepID=UPI0011EFD1DB|nr:hypothetical protein [Azospirillum sp. Sh1]KAA0573452.1 hypothetical protein FZ029_20965 [Azospirillum sp. Sh1]